MRRRIITLLAILTSLPCSIKQDIRQLLDISVNTSAQIEKSKVSNSICAYTSIRRKAKNSGLISSRSRPLNAFLPSL
ncbi:hypothetical protein JGH11_14895 [Dysgonomonas sp. Marseille-P4677]|uniref:hypothetical protein n=1 Tax=Dysgonomonas sp. Marseille-P4677 TaxID=2364790 RepID=UPI001912F486|nr:hypothetical protein [Dysgonomonas sp. Marseille-P4677]MBK5722162.1 hypothetical protein [Dysgonomonas sp. Marseille-P4677]